MPKILIVDDEPFICMLLRQIFEEEGYQISEASNGFEALESYAKNPTDLVITDLIMPDKEGIELIGEMKKKYPNIKIIAMSGGGIINSASYLELAKKLGAFDVFAKPIDRDEILRKIKKALEAK